MRRTLPLPSPCACLRSGRGCCCPRIRTLTPTLTLTLALNPNLDLDLDPDPNPNPNQVLLSSDQNREHAWGFKVRATPVRWRPRNEEALLAAPLDSGWETLQLLCEEAPTTTE